MWRCGLSLTFCGRSVSTSRWRGGRLEGGAVVDEEPADISVPAVPGDRETRLLFR